MSNGSQPHLSVEEWIDKIDDEAGDLFFRETFDAFLPSNLAEESYEECFEYYKLFIGIRKGIPDKCECGHCSNDK